MIANATSIVSERILNMEESATLKMAKMVRELKAKGHDVINLSLGEPDFDTPEHIKTAAKKALDNGYTKYTPVPGLMPLREAICTKFKRDNDLHFTPDNIVVSNGAKQSIYNLCMSLINPGDEVIIFTPYWVSYEGIILLAGGVPVRVYAGIEQDYKVSAQQVKEAITDKTKLVLFSSPCNPTGSVYNADELEAIANVIAPHEHIHIIADEIYEFINFLEGGHVSIGSIESVRNRTITVNGFSKGFAMTGWRLGYIGAPVEIARACAKLQGQVTSGANAFSQMGGAHALLTDMTPSYKMNEAFLKRKKLVIGLLQQIEGIKVNNPDGAFYIFPDISAFFGKSDGKMTIHNSIDFCEYILTKTFVGIVPGSAFGAEGCFRLSYAASEESLTEAIQRIAAALGQLR